MKNILITIISLLIFDISFGQTIWSEDFSAYSAGTGIDGSGNIGDYPSGVTKWTLDVSSATLSNTGDYIKTVSGQMEGRDIDNSVYWESENIDISSYSLINISIDASETGGLEGTDFIRVSYQLDGGSITQFGYESDDFTSTTFTLNDLDVGSNSVLNIWVEMDMNSSNEYIQFDNILVENALDPEPTNHLTSFSATAATTSQIDVSWTDAIGTQLPDGYIIKANTTGTFTNPIDGTDPSEDTDLSDGSALVKVAYGVETYSFSSLSSSTTYYFKAWPYTNSSTNIDFKTDGTVPTANATTLAPAGPGDIFYYVSDASDALYTIDRTTGSTSLIGSLGVTDVEAIANWPSSGNQVLYAANGGTFGTINTTTGAFSTISDVDVDGAANGSEGSISLSDIDGLAFDPRTGDLWASHRRSGTYDILFKINPSTGKFIEDVFGSGVDYITIAGTGVYQDFDDMAVSPDDGTLYGVSNNGTSDQILSINKTTGAITVVSTLSSVSDIEGLGFSNDNHMYGTSGTANDFVEIFWTTGNSTTINSNMGGSGDPESIAALVEDANLIEGKLYHDDNQNQTDDSESGISGVTILLYYDNNGDGYVDGGDEYLASAITDANGEFSFDYASVGDLVLKVDVTTLPSGYSLTTDNQETASFASQSNTDSGNDFGADDGSDCDGNGIPDFTEGTTDTDGDGILDQCDLDNDNDGILDSEETTSDSDGDGIPNYKDLDSDNDGIPDAIEANGGIAPTGYNSATGRIEGSDSDSDGLLNSVDNDPSTAYGAGSTSSLARGDNDGDGYKDFIDKDSDNDGILDIVEAGGADSNGDGEVDSFTDSNSDGLDDGLTSSPLSIPNSDSSWESTYGLTSLPNYLDLDSDNDGIDDSREGYTTAGYQTPSILTDTDGDGILDLWDNNSGGSSIDPIDSDYDGTDDYLDSDSDNDGIDDFIEGNDADNDHVPDVWPLSNTDADGNGIDDSYDNGCSGTTNLNISATDYAEEDNSDGSMYLTSSDIELVNDGATHQTIGLYFSGINVTQGQTISAAYIQFQVDEASTGSVTFTIKGEDTDNATTFGSTTYDASGRTTTTASETWSPADWNTVGESSTNQKTVDISSVIQEIVNRAGWVSGNNIVIIITGADNATAYRTAEVNPTLQISIPGGMTYACGTNIAIQDIDSDSEKDFRDFDDTGDSELPVELISFSANLKDNIVDLNWATATEYNNDYFEVQKSSNGYDFESFTLVDGFGTTVESQYYNTSDFNPYQGITYYRLKQVDFDGAYAYSNIVAVEVNEEIKFNIYPNPSNGIVNIESNINGTIEIINQSGNLIYSEEIFESSKTINLQELAAGIYYIRIITDNEIIAKKLLLQ